MAESHGISGPSLPPRSEPFEMFEVPPDPCTETGKKVKKHMQPQEQQYGSTTLGFPMSQIVLHATIVDRQWVSIHRGMVLLV